MSEWYVIAAVTAVSFLYIFYIAMRVIIRMNGVLTHNQEVQINILEKIGSLLDEIRSSTDNTNQEFQNLNEKREEDALLIAKDRFGDFYKTISAMAADISFIEQQTKSIMESMSAMEIMLLSVDSKMLAPLNTEFGADGK